MLAREALRIATVYALRGATIAGDRVHDSEHGPIEDRANGEALQPIVSVYTDDVTGIEATTDDLFGSGTVSLVIEILVTARMKVRKAAPGDDGYDWTSPQTDQAMELTIGLIERQIALALRDPRNAWGDVFKGFCKSVSAVSSQRGASMREGVRFAGRQLSLQIELPADPIPGRAPGPIWQAFLARVDAEPELQPTAKMLRAMIEGHGLELNPSETLQMAYNLSSRVAQALLLTPPAGAAPESPNFSPAFAPDAGAESSDFSLSSFPTGQP